MKSMNKVQLVGYLGKDPEIKEYPDGKAKATIRLATDRFFPSDKGKVVKQTQWHTVVVWGKERIDKFRNYLVTGSHILVNGELEYRTYQDKTGHMRYTTEIRVNSLVDLDR
jgi:single-strand DNA-binding protein